MSLGLFGLAYQRATALKLILYRKGNLRVIVINVPWYASSQKYAFAYFIEECFSSGSY